MIIHENVKIEAPRVHNVGQFISSVFQIVQNGSKPNHMKGDGISPSLSQHCLMRFPSVCLALSVFPASIQACGEIEWFHHWVLENTWCLKATVSECVEVC